MFCLSGIMASTCYCSSTFLGMAIPTMEQNTFGLCQSLLVHIFLLLVAAHSKWLDVHITPSITAAKTIEKLRIMFANYGLPLKGLLIMEHPWIFDHSCLRMPYFTLLWHLTIHQAMASRNGLCKPSNVVSKLPKVALFKRLSKCIASRLILLLLGYHLLSCSWVVTWGHG